MPSADWQPLGSAWSSAAEHRPSRRGRCLRRARHWEALLASSGAAPAERQKGLDPRIVVASAGRSSQPGELARSHITSLRLNPLWRVRAVRSENPVEGFFVPEASQCVCRAPSLLDARVDRDARSQGGVLDRLEQRHRHLDLVFERGVLGVAKRNDQQVRGTSVALSAWRAWDRRGRARSGSSAGVRTGSSACLGGLLVESRSALRGRRATARARQGR